MLEDIIKEINKIELSENEFLVIKCGEEVTQYQLELMRNVFKSFYNGEFKDRIIVVSGDLEFTKISKDRNLNETNS